MIPPLWRVLLAYLARRPWQAALGVLGIALGMAVVMAVQVSQVSARRSFEEAEQTLTGAATDRVIGARGHVAESIFATLCMQEPALLASPIVTGHAQVEGPSPAWLQVHGIDPLSAVGRIAESHAAGRGVPALLFGEASAVISGDTLRDLGLADGSRINLQADGKTTAVALHGLSPADSGLQLPQDLIVVDLALAQDVLGQAGKLSYIDLVIPESEDGEALRTRIRDRLPPGLELRDLRTDRQAQRDLSRAFETNLTALSLLSLLVGLFLVYHTSHFLVVQRSFLFKRLRALGVHRHEIFLGILVEAAILGALGGVAGILLGLALAQVMIGLIAGTMGNFYYDVPTSGTHVPPMLILSLWSLAICTSVAAAVPAAWRAVRDSRLSARDSAPPSTSWTRPVSSAVILGIVATGIIHFGPASLWMDFAAMSAMLLAAGMLIAPLLPAFSGWLTRRLVHPRWWPERVGAANLTRADNRSGIAAAALCLAAAVSLGMQLMTASFRTSVDDWLSQLLRADAYLSAPESLPASMAEAMLASLHERLVDHPLLAITSSVLQRERSSSLGRLGVTAYELPQPARQGFHFLAGDAVQVWARWEEDDVFIASESLARRHALAPGSRVTIMTDHGEQAFTLAGVYRDYASERGTIALSRRTALRHWTETGYTGLGIYLGEGSTWPEVRSAVLALAGTDSGIQLRTRDDIRRISLGIFDRTFAITRVLGLLALLVSLTGVVGALLAQLLERAREYSVLRALGCRHAELSRVLLCQTLITGALAALMALPTGAVLAVFLVRVVNLHAFGWTMDLVFPPSLFAAMFVSVLAASALAGIYPALRLGRATPAQALREE